MYSPIHARMRIGGRSLEQRRPSKLHIYVCIHVSNRPRERDRCVRFHESSKILLSFHSTPALSILKEDTRLERVASRGLINSSGKPGFVSLLPLPARQRGRRRRRSKIEINFGSVRATGFDRYRKGGRKGRDNLHECVNNRRRRTTSRKSRVGRFILSNVKFHAATPGLRHLINSRAAINSL